MKLRAGTWPTHQRIKNYTTPRRRKNSPGKRKLNTSSLSDQDGWRQNIISSIYKEKHKEYLVQAILKEVNGHCEKNHWKLITKYDIPKGEPILDSAWVINCKGEIKTKRLHKWKSSMNIHGGWKDYDKKYTNKCWPVVNWFYIRLLLIISVINRRNTHQVDFVLESP